MRLSKQQKFWFNCVGIAFLVINLLLMYLFGLFQFMNPEKALQSGNESDRFDGLVYIANEGNEGRRWQSVVIETLSKDPSPDIREMAVITLRELGKSEESTQALENCLSTEKEPSVKEAINELLLQWNP